MTPERLVEIRSRDTALASDIELELLAEVDRLEAVVVGSVAKLRLEARVCDEAKWISEHATAGCGGDPAVYAARSELAISTADSLEAAVARPLDSPPAKR